MFSDMYGVCASRKFMPEEAITAYVGTAIGAYNGERDDYKGYREMERMAVVSGGKPKGVGMSWW